MKLNIFNIKLKLYLWWEKNSDFILHCFFIFIFFYYGYDEYFNTFWDALPIHIEYLHDFTLNGDIISFSFNMYFLKSIPKEVLIEIDLEKFKLSIEINSIE